MQKKTLLNREDLVRAGEKTPELITLSDVAQGSKDNTSFCKRWILRLQCITAPLLA